MCRAVRALKVHWVVSDPASVRGFAREKRAFRGLDRAVHGPGVQLVDHQGSAALYRLTACWP